MQFSARYRSNSLRMRCLSFVLPRFVEAVRAGGYRKSFSLWREASGNSHLLALALEFP